MSMNTASRPKFSSSFSANSTHYLLRVRAAIGDKDFSHIQKLINSRPSSAPR